MVPDPDAAPVPLDDPRAVMEAISGVLMANVSGGAGVAQPMVENLSGLMKDLGAAAGKVFRRK